MNFINFQGLQDLIRSSRFQGVLLIAILQILVVFGVVSDPQKEALGEKNETRIECTTNNKT